MGSAFAANALAAPRLRGRQLLRAPQGASDVETASAGTSPEAGNPLPLDLVDRRARDGRSTATSDATVTDRSGAIVPSAKVTLIHEETGAASEKTPDASGDAVFSFLPVSLFTIRAEPKGFKRR